MQVSGDRELRIKHFSGRHADQTLYGMASLSHLLSGDKNSSRTIRALFGAESCALGTAMGGRPYELFERVGHEYWPNLEALLNEHMLFPLYRALASPERYAAAVAAAMQPGR